MAMSEARRLRKKETSRLWRLANKERYAASRKAWYAANKDRMAASHQRWMKAHGEQYSQYMREWRKANPEKVVRALQNWQEANREHVREKCREFYKQHPELWKIYFHRRRARLKGNGGNFSPQEWSALKRSYGNKCLCCGRVEDVLLASGLTLSPDHVLPLSKGGTNDIENIQPLCHGTGGCNNKKSDKHVDYREVKCPSVQ